MQVSRRFIWLTVLQWVIIDSKVFDLSRFAAMHPGGLSVLLDEEVGRFVRCRDV